MSDAVEHIDRLIEAINRCLSRRCSRLLKVGLTDVPDGDFLGTTVSDHWAATTATLTYATLSMANGVMQRILNVLTTSANGYAQSDAIPVEPLETRNFQIFMRNAATLPTTVATATLVLRDLTNGATITPTFSRGAATSTSHAFVTPQGTYVVPAGCSQVAWRLQGAESGAICQFGMLIDNAVNQRTFFTQPHLATEDDFTTLYIGRQGGTTTSGPEDMSFVPVAMDGISFSDMGYGLAVEFDANPGFPMFYDELSFFPTLSIDTDATDADEELVLCGAAIELFTMLKNRSTERPQVSRGRIVPTAVQIKIDDAQARWDSPRISRLRAPMRRSKRRTYRLGVTA